MYKGVHVYRGMYMYKHVQAHAYVQGPASRRRLGGAAKREPALTVPCGRRLTTIGSNRLGCVQLGSRPKGESATYANSRRVEEGAGDRTGRLARHPHARGVSGSESEALTMEARARSQTSN